MRETLVFVLATAVGAAALAQRPSTIEITRGGKIVASNRSAAGADLRVLFIGNSLTYWNEMPWMFERVAASRGAQPYAEFSGRSGVSLRDHWKLGAAQKRIRERRWNFVVLQPKSSELMRDPQQTSEYARKFDDLIRASGAKTVIFMTWAPRAASYSQKDLTERYLELGRALRAHVAPVGVLWDELQRAGLVMEEGGAHPTLLGSYLSACVFYATLYRKSPVGAVHRFDAKFDIPEFYRRGLEHDTIPAHVAETIQRKAAKAF